MSVHPRPLHLYRALIREATYLPDPLARQKVSQYVRERFEANRLQKPHLRLHRLEQARRGLSVLERANCGERDRLRKVLMFTYGRIGKEKHKLWKPILSIPPTQPPQEIIPGNPRTKPPPISPALRAVLKAHRDRDLLKKPTDASIPKTNAWGRPMPRRRIANIHWKHHAALMKKAAPPLDVQAFARLEGLVSGKVPLGPRRVRPERRVRMPPASMDTEGHRVTERFVRRILKEVLAVTPYWDVTDEGVYKSGFSEYLDKLGTLRWEGDRSEFEAVGGGMLEAMGKKKGKMGRAGG